MIGKKRILRNDASSSLYARRLGDKPPKGAFWKQDLKTFGMADGNDDDQFPMHRARPKEVVRTFFHQYSYLIMY